MANHAVGTYLQTLNAWKLIRGTWNVKMGHDARKRDPTKGGSLNLAELDAWVEGEPEQQSPKWRVVHERPRKLKGVWRDKKMRADRSPAYVTNHRSEKHLWLRPRVIHKLRKEVK